MLLLPTAYLAPVQHYAHLYRATCAYEERCEHYVKQTYRNRCYIATPTGAQPLTLPVERSGAAHQPVRDLRLSNHGRWQHLHCAAIISAYEGTPFFEYYADDFLPVYEQPFRYLVDFNARLQQIVLDALDLQRPVHPTERYLTPDEAAARHLLDLRAVISPKAPAGADARFKPRPYYQVFAGRTGFLPNLSIIDLLFNMGPEARLILRDSLAEYPRPPRPPR